MGQTLWITLKRRGGTNFSLKIPFSTVKASLGDIFSIYSPENSLIVKDIPTSLIELFWKLG